MEKVEEAEVNEKTEEGTPLHVASESVMEVLRESRENIQSILPHVLERLEVRRLQETLKHEVEEATYIAIHHILRDAFDEVLDRVLKERIAEKVEGILRDAISSGLKDRNIEEIIGRKIEEKAERIADEKMRKIEKMWGEGGALRILKDRIKDRILEDINEETLEELKKKLLERIEEERPVLMQMLSDLIHRISTIEERIIRVENALMNVEQRAESWRGVRL